MILPTHLAIIIDGNGRWAQKRGLPRMAGHKYGLENLKKIVAEVKNLGIKFLTVFAFSCENWNRSKKEVDGLKDLFLKLLNEDAQKYADEGYKVNFFGEIDDFGDEIASKAKQLMKNSSKNDNFVLNLCMSYGARQEIIKAVNQILKENKKSININEFSQYLYTKDIPDPDFVIRTSGEIRTSNFMAFQTTYSEWLFPKVYWPSFKKRHLMKALKIFAKRDRRFGAIKEKV